MRIVIIEDEKPAAEKLVNALKECNDKVEVCAVLNNIGTASEWFSSNSTPDLVFMDIELTDGLSFVLFDKVSITCPVIFTTAYDEYWQEAFEHNSIDYLLKPIKTEKLKAALSKYELLKTHFANNLQLLLKSQPNHHHKKRFLVKRGMDYVSVRTEDIAYFYATHKLVCMVDSKNQKFILDQSLAEIEKQLDSSIFYRANRKFIVSIHAIKKMKTFPKSKLLLEVEPAINEDIIISQENVAEFKSWVGG